ncbi:unnamed protein product, partial [Discosporangium mesarthrocarpum]
PSPHSRGRSRDGHDALTKVERPGEERRSVVEDLIVSAAQEHLNAAPSFIGGSKEVELAEQCLSLVPWASPAVAEEKRLIDAGNLAAELGCDLAPLQLRLRLIPHGNESGTSTSTSTSTSLSGVCVKEQERAMAVLRSVLDANPWAYKPQLLTQW